MKDFRKLINAYQSFFSEKSFINLIKARAKKIGTKAIYTGLLMFYSFQRKETPHWAKNIIIGALGYLVSPIDLVPDLTPVLGYTDDFGVLSFGLVAIASFINKDVRQKALTKLDKWFNSFDSAVIEEVDRLI